MLIFNTIVVSIMPLPWRLFASDNISDQYSSAISEAEELGDFLVLSHRIPRLSPVFMALAMRQGSHTCLATAAEVALARGFPSG